MLLFRHGPMHTYSLVSAKWPLLRGFVWCFRAMWRAVIRTLLSCPRPCTTTYRYFRKTHETLPPHPAMRATRATTDACASHLEVLARDAWWVARKAAAGGQRPTYCSAQRLTFVPPMSCSCVWHILKHTGKRGEGGATWLAGVGYALWLWHHSFPAPCSLLPGKAWLRPFCASSGKEERDRQPSALGRHELSCKAELSTRAACVCWLDMGPFNVIFTH